MRRSALVGRARRSRPGSGRRPTAGPRRQHRIVRGGAARIASTDIVKRKSQPSSTRQVDVRGVEQDAGRIVPITRATACTPHRAGESRIKAAGDVLVLGRERPLIGRNTRSRAFCPIDHSSRVLPMPAIPASRRNWPRPTSTSSSRRSTSSSRSSRPISRGLRTDRGVVMHGRSVGRTRRGSSVIRPMTCRLRARVEPGRTERTVRAGAAQEVPVDGPVHGCPLGILRGLG